MAHVPMSRHPNWPPSEPEKLINSIKNIFLKWYEIILPIGGLVDRMTVRLRLVYSGKGKIFEHNWEWS